MIGLIFIANAAAATVGKSDLVEMARIVAPYAECTFRREEELESVQDAWSEITKKAYADKKNAALSAESERQATRLMALKKQIRQDCGYDKIHEIISSKLTTLYPGMDEARAFWFARNIFQQMNDLNDKMVHFKAGIFPKNPVAPPSSPPFKPNEDTGR